MVRVSAGGVITHEQELAFHWSPRERRKGIEREGLMPGKLSRDGLWRPPFVCLSFDPLLAWQLSGRYQPTGTWDLWQVYLADLDGWENIMETYRDSDRSYVKEIRVYERIFKRDVRHVAERVLP